MEVFGISWNTVAEISLWVFGVSQTYIRLGIMLPSDM